MKNIREEARVRNNIQQFQNVIKYIFVTVRNKEHSPECTCSQQMQKYLLQAMRNYLFAFFP